MSPRWSGVVAAVVLSFARHAPAAGGFDITWQAPESCGTKADFEAGVSRIVGKSFAGLGSSWARADVVIVSTAEAWRLRVRVVPVSGARRERDVLTATCREAVEAAELIVATSLSEAEPERTEQESSAGARSPASDSPRDPSASAPKNTAPATNAPPPSPSSIAPKPASEARPPSASTRHLALSLGVRVGVEPLLLKSATTFASLAFALESERLRGEVSLAASYPETEAASGGGRARAELTTSALLGCYGGHARAFALWGCLGAEAGLFAVTGEGSGNLINARTSYQFWGAGLGQAEGSARLSRVLDLVLGIQGMATSRRIRVVQRGAEDVGSTPVYRTAAADVRPWLGVEGRF